MASLKMGTLLRASCGIWLARPGHQRPHRANRQPQGPQRDLWRAFWTPPANMRVGRTALGSRRRYEPTQANGDMVVETW